MTDKKTEGVQRETEHSYPKLWIPSVRFPDSNLSVQYGVDNGNPSLEDGDENRHLFINKGFNIGKAGIGTVLSYQNTNVPGYIGKDQHAGHISVFVPLVKLKPEDMDKYMTYALATAMGNMEAHHRSMMEGSLQKAKGTFPYLNFVPHALVFDGYFRDKDNQSYAVTAPLSDTFGLGLGYSKAGGKDCVTLGAVFSW
jgi:hypothetical protein